MSRKDDRKKRKKQERDRRQQEYKHFNPRTVQFAISPRVEARFSDNELRQFIGRTCEKHDRKSRFWISYYRTLYGVVAVIVERPDKGLICYLDEVPPDIQRKYPATGWKYDDQTWGNYVKAMWQATDGHVDGTAFGGQPVPEGSVLIEPMDAGHGKVTVGPHSGSGLAEKNKSETLPECNAPDAEK
jgi:hypothetical protein